MSIYYPGCATTIPNPECSDCPPKELAGVRGFFAVKEAFAFTNIEDINEWWAGIAAGNIYLYPKSRGSVEQNEVEEPGWGDQVSVVSGYEFVASVFEPNYASNIDHWNAMKRSNQWKFGYRTETKLYLSDKPAGWIPKAPVSEDLKAAVNWNIMVKFTQEDHPTAYDIPTGLFAQCVDNA